MMIAGRRACIRCLKYVKLTQNLHTESLGYYRMFNEICFYVKIQELTYFAIGSGVVDYRFTLDEFEKNRKEVTDKSKK